MAFAAEKRTSPFSLTSTQKSSLYSVFARAVQPVAAEMRNSWYLSSFAMEPVIFRCAIHGRDVAIRGLRRRRIDEAVDSRERHRQHSIFQAAVGQLLASPAQAGARIVVRDDRAIS